MLKCRKKWDQKYRLFKRQEQFLQKYQVPSLKMYSFFAFAFKVCKKCFYDPKYCFMKNNNMGINKY